VSELAGGIYNYINNFRASITTIKYHLYSKQEKHFSYIKMYGMGVLSSL